MVSRTRKRNDSDQGDARSDTACSDILARQGPQATTIIRVRVRVGAASESRASRPGRFLKIENLKIAEGNKVWLRYCNRSNENLNQSFAPERAGRLERAAGSRAAAGPRRPRCGGAPPAPPAFKLPRAVIRAPGRAGPAGGARGMPVPAGVGFRVRRRGRTSTAEFTSRTGRLSGRDSDSEGGPPDSARRSLTRSAWRKKIEEKI